MILKTVLTKYVGKNDLPTDSQGFVPDDLDEKADEFDWTGCKKDWSRSTRSEWKAFVKSVIEQIDRLAKAAKQRDPSVFPSFWVEDQVYSDDKSSIGWLIEKEASDVQDEAKARGLDEDLWEAVAGNWQQFITGMAVDELESVLLKFHGQEGIDKIKKARLLPWVEGSGLPIRKKKGGKKK